MDEETRAHVDSLHQKIDDTRAQVKQIDADTRQHVARIDRVIDKLSTGQDEIRAAQANDRLTHAKEYGDLNLSIQAILPEALRAVPKEFEEERARQLREKEIELEKLDHDTNRRILKWSVVSAIIAAIAVAIGFLHV